MKNKSNNYGKFSKNIYKENPESNSFSKIKRKGKSTKDFHKNNNETSNRKFLGKNQKINRQFLFEW